MKKYYIFPIFALMLLLSSCNKEDPNKPDPNQIESAVTKMVYCNTDNAIETDDGVKLFIPKGAFVEDMEVTVGILGDEPKSFANKDMVLHGNPFSVIIPTSKLNKSLSLQIPKPTGYIPDGGFVVFGFDGLNYLPYSYEEKGDYLNIEIDSILFNSSVEDAIGLKKKSKGKFVVAVMSRASSKTYRGLFEIKWSPGGVPFDSLIELREAGIGRDEKVLILVHGLLSSPKKCWYKFLKEFRAQDNIQYDRYLAFGYNTTLQIADNGIKFMNVIASNFSTANKNIDIIGHSMGGLVSRYAIENSAVDKFVNKLVTLGTPHLGTPPATIFHYNTAVLGSESEPYYTYTGNGLSDLSPESDFIKKLSKNDASSVPYCAIAAINAPGVYSDFMEEILPDLDDGIVTVTSAHGINLSNPESDIKSFHMDVPLAHIHMTDDKRIIKEAIQFLKGYMPIPEIEWIEVPSGSFFMGSKKDGVYEEDELPGHKVILSSFRISKYPITFAQYDYYCEQTGLTKPSDNGWGRGKRPVINVTWKEANDFAKWHGAQLPTEAQWEYACRGGTRTAYFFGDLGDAYVKLQDYAWFEQNSGRKTIPVGKKLPHNGIYDMYGNVLEWCRDWYGPYSPGQQVDPQGYFPPFTYGQKRVCRGGSFHSPMQGCRSAIRYPVSPGSRSSNVGFRIVMPN